MAEPVIVFGLGAQTKYILDNFAVSGRYQVRRILARNISASTPKDICGVPIVSWTEGSIEALRLEGVLKGIVIDSNNRTKAALMTSVKEMGFMLVNAIHPYSTVAKTARIGCNVVINANSVVQPFSNIGSGVMVHAGVIVEHDNSIENFVNLAPGVTLAGWVHVGEAAYLYTNASVIPRRKIGSDSIVGAGAVVLNDVPDRAVAVGNPARVIKYL